MHYERIIPPMTENVLMPKLIAIPQIEDSLGSLGILEGSELVPFDMRRVYFIHSVPAGSVRGSHAHKTLQQVIFAASGSLDLILDDGDSRYEFELSNATMAVQIPPGYWRTLANFSNNAICVVLASQLYDESDYIRDYKAFLEWRKG
jgi:dTDP-4-dehydrorhamnose 3,5-epimerase-like enzyme